MKIKHFEEGSSVYIKASLSNVKFDADFMKRIFNIAAWLNKRYDFNSNDVQYEHSFLDDDAINNLLTIRLTFYGERE